MIGAAILCLNHPYMDYTTAMQTHKRFKNLANIGMTE